MQTEASDRGQDATDSPVAWFATLERARRDNDFELAARAMRELRRLGVVVKYHRRRADNVDAR